MAPRGRVGIVVWCQNVCSGQNYIPRKIGYTRLLQILSEMTNFSLSQYYFSVSGKLCDNDRSQLLPITCDRDLSFWFNNFDVVELFVDIQALPSPPPPDIPLAETLTHMSTYDAMVESERQDFDLNLTASDTEDEITQADTLPINERVDGVPLTGPDLDASGPEFASDGDDDDDDDDDDDGGLPLPTSDFPSNKRVPPHPVLSHASFFDTIGDDMYVDSFDMPRELSTYDPDVGILNVGMMFKSKIELQTTMTNYSIKHAMREFKVVESKPTKWSVSCKLATLGTAQCGWFMKAKCDKKNQMWSIRYLGPQHSCLINATNQRHHNLSRNLIAEIVGPQVRIDPSYPANLAMELVKQSLNYKPTYNMAWKGIRRAIENVYGTWESSCAYLPKYMAVIQRYNPGSVVEWRHAESGPSEGEYMLGYVFWAFQPMIDAWQHCRRVISVDGTHLYTSYKNKLLIAMGMDANQMILPLAYAVVDEESKRSWRWFLDRLSVHVIRGADGVCLISDRHAGILKAVEEMDDFRPPRGVHRYCLRHVKSNLNTQFKSVELKDLCAAAGSAATVREFERYMVDIQGLCIGAWEYLNKIEREKWTLSHDGGYRFGVMTTNVSECFNGVLKGVRRLPITAIVRATFSRSVKFYIDREKAALLTQQMGYPWPHSIRKKYDKAQRLGLSERFTVEIYNHAVLSANVVSLLSGSRRSWAERVTLSNLECSCGKWTRGGVPCPHAMAVCRTFGVEPSAFVHLCFSAQAYVATYTSSRFFALGNEVDWDEPSFKLRHNTCRRVSRRGRNVSTRIHNEMDWPQTRDRQQYQSRNSARGSTSRH